MLAISDPSPGPCPQIPHTETLRVTARDRARGLGVSRGASDLRLKGRIGEADAESVTNAQLFQRLGMQDSETVFNVEHSAYARAEQGLRSGGRREGGATPVEPGDVQSEG
eukprot:763522-Rhodomonas_salina.1